MTWGQLIRISAAIIVIGAGGAWFRRWLRQRERDRGAPDDPQNAGH